MAGSNFVDDAAPAAALLSSYGDFQMRKQRKSEGGTTQQKFVFYNLQSDKAETKDEIEQEGGDDQGRTEDR